MIRETFLAAAVIAGLSFSGSAAWADAGQVTTKASPQSACKVGECEGVACPAGYTCVYSPKQCITAPCPQYECVPIGGTTPTIPIVTPPVVLPPIYGPGWPYYGPGWPYYYRPGWPRHYWPPRTHPVPLPRPVPRSPVRPFHNEPEGRPAIAPQGPGQSGLPPQGPGRPGSILQGPGQPPLPQAGPGQQPAPAPHPA
ncbi:hypothetical protein [Sphaerisporangium fuscum]|uniref:hypothetical protein n=1 Tax=Sphaerisporangium fuscum TaxID=2835868 RepID=UPI001BDD5E21|nr:hypothetical protein [Sphaerisporangium fuscum]